jgi:hypothetical protein
MAQAQRKNDPEAATLTDQVAGRAPIDQVAGQDPIFDEDAPHGIVVGDSEVAYVQNGHQFGRDRHYLQTEKHRGSPKAFDPRKVGLVRRPKPVTLDD